MKCIIVSIIFNIWTLKFILFGKLILVSWKISIGSSFIARILLSWWPKKIKFVLRFLCSQVFFQTWLNDSMVDLILFVLDDSNLFHFISFKQMTNDKIFVKKNIDFFSKWCIWWLKKIFIKFVKLPHTHTHTMRVIGIFMFVCVGVCVCGLPKQWFSGGSHNFNLNSETYNIIGIHKYFQFRIFFSSCLLCHCRFGGCYDDDNFYYLDRYHHRCCCCLSWLYDDDRCLENWNFHFFS